MSGYQIFWTVWVLFVLVLFRFMWAIERTYQDRIKFIHWAFKQPNHKPIIRSFDEVEYRKHLWSVFLGRDPWQLYEQPSEIG